jgi:hypothetical protein
VRNETESGFQLEGSAPEAYEAYLVPTLFETCARHLIAAVGLAAGARVVDVACGTGVVGRQAAALVGPAASSALTSTRPWSRCRHGWRRRWTGGSVATPPMSVRAPFALGVREELRDLLVAAGFAEPILTLLAFAARFPSAPELLRQEVAAPHWPTSSPGCPPRSRTGWPSRSDAAWTTSPTTTASRPRCRPGWRSLTGRRAIPPGRRPTAGCR